MPYAIAGNNHIFNYLSKSIANNKLAHTYIFAGPDNLGKATAATRFAKILLCSQKMYTDIACENCASCKKMNIDSKLHSDFNILEKKEDKKNISIEQVREFIAKLNMSSFANSYKIGIIKDAENLNENSSNALLKTLEEPKIKVLIILTTSNFNGIIPTIRSRSQVLKFNLVSQDIIYNFLIKEHKVSRDGAKNLSQMCVGRPALALKLSKDAKFLKKYLNRINIFTNFSKSNINTRFNLIDEIINKKLESRALAEEINEVIKTWQIIIRDLLLLEFSREDLIKNNVILEELKEIKQFFNINKLVKLMQNLTESRKYLSANVAPRSILENIAINF